MNIQLTKLTPSSCWLLFTALFHIQSCGVCAEKTYDVDPIATVTQGQLRGKFGESRNGKDYLEFLGIPYAQVTETFKPAAPPIKWDGIREATSFGDRCMQFDKNTHKVIGSESCLVLNIYRPMEMEKVLPCLVYIHGGAFMFGSGEDYGPQYFMDEDIILITFNYRLGALGFLNTGDEMYPGNLGMKDQVLALRWIRDNIASFGGDPQKVTIFGDSSGSASVSYHILSPMSRGLFSNAISSSGNSLCPWAFVDNPKSVAKRLSFSIGCPTKNPRYLVACLMNKEPSEIGWDDDPIVPFAPSIEDSRKVLGTVFLPDHPISMLESGNFNRVPWITGVNDQEGATLYSAIILNSTELTEEFNKNWHKIAPFALGYQESEESDLEATNDIRKYYFGTQPVGLETRDNLTNMFSDRNFFQCTKTAALLHARYSPVHMYYFTQTGEMSWLDIFKIPKDFGYHGVAHSDPLQFFFKLHNFPEIKAESTFSVFSQRLVKLWASFVESGKPTYTWGEFLEWNPMQLSELSGLSPVKYLQLDGSSSRVIMEPFTERLDFWESPPINLTNIHIAPL
ncbi:Venom carboxylesterase-6 [Orchesella cincta]|uniref:Carboxylic ester hydrolase n=1 Tax=Orchesella cincta TaxID=48709 RepID=A0A1D2N0Q3_ORCCI|nr:Venom carboxylesterase-6 [Orchesella cincta]